MQGVIYKRKQQSDRIEGREYVFCGVSIGHVQPTQQVYFVVSEVWRPLI